MSASSNGSWTIDAIKATASQLIVFHHLVAYGPLSDTVYPYAAGLMDWLYDHARQVVQMFLVVGGFLAAKSMEAQALPRAAQLPHADLPGVLWARYVRLVLPYAVAMLLAILSAAVARELIDNPDTPAMPTPWQFLMHVLLLQGIAEVPALSAGVWYIAIDFQLYAVFVLLLWSARQLAALVHVEPGRFAAAGFIALTMASLLWFNRNPALDKWAAYFFGAYGMGILAYWANRSQSRWVWLAGMAMLLLLALVVEWRSRIALAGATAFLLAVASAPAWSSCQRLSGLIKRLGSISYSLFLVHYPVALLVGAIFAWAWPGRPAIHALGLAAAWLLSLAAAAALHDLVERKSLRARRVAAADFSGRP